jgi:GLPGLI family protein
MIKKIILLSLFALYINFTFSQKNEPVEFKITYSASLKVLNNIVFDDTCLLEISKSYSYFKSMGKGGYEERVKLQIEKVLANNDDDKSIVMPAAHYFPYTAYKLRDEKKSFIIRRLGEGNYRFEVDDLFAKNWQITQDTSVIAGFVCIKAFVYFDTTKIEAWFAPSIPISDGPLFLMGLPGLIVKTISSSGMKTEIMSIEQCADKNELNYFDEKYIETTYKDFMRAAKGMQEKAALEKAKSN